MFENALELNNLNMSNKIVELKRKFLMNIDHKLFLRGIKSFTLRVKDQNYLGQIRLANWSFWGILLSILLFTIVTEGFDHFLLIYLQRIGGNIYINGIVCGVIQVFAYLTTYYMADYRRMLIFRVVSIVVILSSLFFVFAKFKGLD